MNMSNVIHAILILGIMGGVFGVMLAIASKIFYVLLILLFITFVVPLFEDPLIQGFINLIVFICTLLLIGLLIKGVGNRRNTNRNSAAIIAAVEFMQSLNKDQKRRIGFVFTDRNRRRCDGAAVLMNYFQEQKKNPDIIELNCIGTGDTLGIGYRMHGKRLAALLNAGKSGMKTRMSDMNGDKCLQTSMYHYEKGVMICCGTPDEKGGLLVSDTQCGKDRVMEERNLDTVKQLLAKAAERL